MGHFLKFKILRLHYNTEGGEAQGGNMEFLFNSGLAMEGIGIV